MLRTFNQRFPIGAKLNELCANARVRKAGKMAAALAVIAFTNNILFDAEYAGDAVFGTGIIAHWADKLNPAGRVNNVYEGETADLFPEGQSSVVPENTIQGRICDCKFVASVASLASTAAGQRAIVQMIRANEDGSYTVVFPGAPSEPQEVSQFSPEELYFTAGTSEDGFDNGMWLPVLEKAYGQIRDKHQPVTKLFLRTVKHSLFEGRISAHPEYPSFAASYGATDEGACQLLTGHSATVMPTVAWEIGDMGLGKDYATLRQLRSWFNRSRVVAEFYAEQEQALKAAFKNGALVIATTDCAVNVGRWGIRPHHAYSVLSFDASKHVLTIRDPQGPRCKSEYHPVGDPEPFDGEQDGQFNMTVEQFNRLFSKLRIEQNQGT